MGSAVGQLINNNTSNLSLLNTVMFVFLILSLVHSQLEHGYITCDLESVMDLVCNLKFQKTAHPLKFELFLDFYLLIVEIISVK
jgi:hypothetical protein